MAARPISARINRQPVPAVDWAGALTQPIAPNMSGVILVGFAVLMLITAGFVSVSILGGVGTLVTPISLGIGAFFGLRLGIWVSLSYLLVGLLGWPVFANGGGLDYWQQPGFAYLLALPVATGLAGQVIYGWRQPWLAPVLAVVVPVVVLHTLGAAGLCLQAALGIWDASALPGWVNTLSLHSLPQDLILSTVSVGVLAPMVRLLLNWLL